MSDVIFEGCARLRFEGEFVLELDRLFPDHIEYGVIGARHLPVAFHDYRPAGLEALSHARATGDLARFAAIFNAVAHVTVSKNVAENSLLIKAYDAPSGGTEKLGNSAGSEAQHILWIAAGFEGKLPLQRYLYYYAEPTDDRRCVLISLYRQRRAAARTCRSGVFTMYSGASSNNQVASSFFTDL